MRAQAAVLCAALGALLGGCDDSTTVTPSVTVAPPGGRGHTPVSSSAAVDAPAPVLLIVLENREYGDVIAARDAPYLHSLLARGALATATYATAHPSLPNYVELLTGTTAGLRSDCTECRVETPTLVDELSARGLDWRAYMDGAVAPCPLGASTGRYAMKHDPFMYIPHLRDSPAACGRVMPGERLAADAAAGRLPPFTWVTPDLCEDGHDCPLSDVDAWLQATLGGVLTSSWAAAGGVVLITWDEGTSDAGCCGGAAGGHIVTASVSSRVRPGLRVPTAADQAGLLRALEDHFGLPRLGDSACACSGDLSALLGD